MTSHWCRPELSPRLRVARHALRRHHQRIEHRAGHQRLRARAELHVLKVHSGGRVSDLLAALDECIERELDLINISVVSEDSPSC